MALRNIAKERAIDEAKSFRFDKLKEFGIIGVRISATEVGFKQNGGVLEKMPNSEIEKFLNKNIR